ncbi:TonB-dependent receptor [Prosthecochloris sp.]|uniref:TonB-dependent receptor n=1 Tax=Prosthecochloris sp. TaxID=290513 RepID=UPI0025CF7310|nr:TonB-dependent receptor [Prosthecochloris sp.]
MNVFCRKNNDKVLKRTLMICLVITIGLSPYHVSRATDNPEASILHQLGPITVTAQKQSQDVQDIPNSITVLDDIAIEDARITDMESLSDNVPNLEFYNFGSRRHSLTFMRGIKSLHNAEPAIGYYVDGVNYSKSYMFDFPLFDVERIEILRGPQGTLYGRNTMGGVINIYTRKPDNETAVCLAGSLEDYDTREIKGYLRTPLIANTLFLGIAGLVSASDGYIENDYGTGKDGRYTDGQSGRLQLRYLPNTKWDITLGIDGQQHDDGVFVFRRTERNAFVKKGMFAADRKYHYSHDFEGRSENSYWGSSLNVTHDMEFGRLTSITGYRDYDNDEMIDTDFSPLDMTRMRYVMGEKTFSQEVRLASPKQDHSLQWLTGLSYFHADSENKATTCYRPAMAQNPANPFQPGTGSRLKATKSSNEGMAVFGQATYPLLEKLDLTVGLRYEYERAEMDATLLDTPEGGITTTTIAPTLDNDFSALSPKTSLAWHCNDERMLYATFAGGYRSGGFNVFGDRGTYDEEQSWLYEIGAKTRFFNRRLILNLAGFYTDIEDEQIAQFDADTNQPYISNAGASHRLGFEIEAQAVLLPGLDMSTSFSWIEAEYDSYSDPVTGCDYEGNNVFGVPDHTFHVALQYRRPLCAQWDLFSRIELSGVGTRYFDDANTVKDSSYELLNLKLGMESDHLDFYVWAKNLLDRHYVLFENVAKGIAEDGEPLTAGISLNYRL